MESKSLKSFRDLIVWQKAVDVASLVYMLTDEFPKSELYGLTNQMRRAAVSISSNIAEGFKRSHKKEKLQFYNVAYGSTTELESQTEIAKKLNFFAINNYHKLNSLIIEVGKMLDGLIKSVNKNNSKSSILNSLSLSLVLYFVTLYSISYILYPSLVFASTTNGTIDAANAYAYGENIGWINFGTAEGAAAITDSGMTGYGWGENIGWISLNCSNTSSCGTVNYGVSNNNEGTLSGYAWGENVGWISFNCSNTSSCGTVNYGVSVDSSGNFSGYAWGENVGWISFNCSNTSSCGTVNYGVSVDSSGNFSGYAWGENVGWISFNCSNTSSCGTVNYYILTDWRPASTRSSAGTGSGSNSGGGGGGPGSLPPPPSHITAFTEPQGITEPSGATPPPAPVKPQSFFEKLKEKIIPLIPSFLKPPPAPLAPPPIVIPKIPPLSFRRCNESSPLSQCWNLLPVEAIRRFALAPLPRKFVSLTKKFPKLGQTFAHIGIAKITDIQKIKNTIFTLPGLTEASGIPNSQKIVAGKFTIPAGIPVNDLPANIKAKLPSEVLFAKTGGNLIDFNIVLSVKNTGEPEQRIETISGAALSLAVKLDGPAKSVRGYIVFKSRATTPPVSAIDRNSLLASLVFSAPTFAKPAEAARYVGLEGEITTGAPPAPQKQIENRLVLREFEYTDPDKDGIYTANVEAPIPAGEYEIITLIEYFDPELGTREIRLTAVIDPEGYVFEKNGGKETRIPGSAVSLYWFDPGIQGFVLWPADQYAQENPQITDIRGSYSFLVPEGRYYLKATAPGYGDHTGKEFLVRAGSGVHENIELRSKYVWIPGLDPKTMALLIVILFLLYNFYRDKMRERALKNPRVLQQ